jgi:hypothetical protein
MHKYLVILTLGCIGLTASGEEGLDGRRIALEAGDHVTLNAPLTLPCDTVVEANQRVRLFHSRTSKHFPVTVRNGELTMIPEGAMANSSHKFTIQIHNDVRPPHVQIREGADADTLDVYIDDVHFTTYHHSNENRKPFLWPVLSDGRVPVTRAWPMGEAEDKTDHPHHKSLWSAYGEVNGADCWGEGKNAGYQLSGDVTFGSGDAYGWIEAKNTWTDTDKNPVVDESREYRFYTGKPSARLFDVVVTFTAKYGDVKFGDTKEGGIVAVRVRDQIRADRGGVITNAAGLQGEGKTWGVASPWCDYSGEIEGVGQHGITVFDHPGNLRHPSRWHVRNYGLMGANCFGLSYFTKGKGDLNGDYELKDGETLTFRYRVYVHSGDVEEAKVADRYADYATPPKVAWVE